VIAGGRPFDYLMRRWLAAISGRGSDPSEFAGKIVVIYCSSGQGGGVLEGARIVRVGFSNFVVGRRVELRPSLRQVSTNVTAWFNINEISQMYVYDEIESARRAFDSDGT
jgi:hypothetical protein